jgi:uncharacterized membrane protein YcaP (DUF421 family)
MDAVLRATAIYLLLLVIFRIAGKRSLAQITTFDFVLLLIIGEATQQALLGNDFSMTKAVLVIVTLIMLDIGFSLVQGRFPNLTPWLEDMPLLLVENGRMLKKAMDQSRISEADLLHAARTLQGLERMDQIKFAVLERTGEISIIPKEPG